jgi:Icc protein
MSTASGCINLVQLSDPHLFGDEQGSMYGLNTLQSLQAVVAEVARHPFDLGVVTGDLSQDLQRAGYQRLREVLQGLKMPFHLIPGNHDDWSLITAEFQQGAISCAKQVVLGAWQIILLNTQVEGEVGGFLSQAELNWLEQCLASGAAPYAVVCIHHHPVNIGSKWLEQIGLGNSDKLFEVLASHKQVKALLWGHVHQEFDESRAGLRLLSCPSTCIQFKPGSDRFELDLLPPGYRWLRLYDDGSLETGVKRLDRIPGRIDAAQKGY